MVWSPHVPSPLGRVDLSGLGAGLIICSLTRVQATERQQSLPQGADNLCGCFQLPEFADKKIVLLETFESLGCTAHL